MKFSYSWLTEHLKTNVHFEEIEKKLTSIGLEVEDIQDTGKAYQDFIVGQVLEEKKHPNADKLKLCKVDIGKEKVDVCLLYTSPSPRDVVPSRMPSSA